MTSPRPSLWRRLLARFRPSFVRRSENRSLILDVGSGAEIRVNAKAQRRLKRLLVWSLLKWIVPAAMAGVAAVVAAWSQC